jgi:hypothetical protein
MDNKLLFIASVLLSSCAPSFSQENLFGNYQAEGKDYSYKLKLATDSTFQLITWHIEVKSGCEGTWKVSNNDTILLKCSVSKPLEELQGGYMSDREKKVTIRSNGKLKMDNVELRLIK